jgi:predicted amidophosphoribosyltransferase
VVVLREPLCARCGAPARPREVCPCAELGGFRSARSLVVFAPPARALTLALKRRARPRSIAAVGALLADLARCEGLGGRDAVVTYVPAGRSARRRGFDHAALIARAVAAGLERPLMHLLVRAHEGPRQSEVPLAERRENVAGRFAAKRTGAAVLLVDDVFTTGATSEACANVLLEAGAEHVDVLTWARTLRRRA